MSKVLASVPSTTGRKKKKRTVVLSKVGSSPKFLFLSLVVAVKLPVKSTEPLQKELLLNPFIVVLRNSWAYKPRVPNCVCVCVFLI